MKFEFYIHNDGDCVRCVTQSGFSDHFPDEEPDGFIGSPEFIRTGLGSENWKKISYTDLPDWAKDQLESGEEEGK